MVKTATQKFYAFISQRCDTFLYCVMCVTSLIRAGSLNQSAATASSEPILKAARLLEIFKRKMWLVSQKHLGNALARWQSSFTAASEPLVFFGSMFYWQHLQWYRQWQWQHSLIYRHSYGLLSLYYTKD